MGNEARAFYSKQRRAPVFGVVQTLFEIVKGAAREQESDLACNCRGKSFLQSSAHQIHDPFRSFQRNIADESISNDHIHISVVNVAAFDVAAEIDRQLL